jgi:hypothetical protein
MPSTARGIMRGSFYSTNLVARCPSYHPCELCTGCTKFDSMDIVCLLCEARKSFDLICNHTDEQQYAIKRMNEIMHGPIFHPDQTPRDVPGVDVSNIEDFESVVNTLKLTPKES